MHGLIIDNFAGGGGASIGIEQGLGRPVDIAVNHDAKALAMHTVNHPWTKHLQENVFAVDPVEVCGGRPVDLAWFSPDCTHYSRAKGGRPRKKNIRGLAWIVVRWARAVRPKVIILENVGEFEDWGPLTREGQPCPVRKGKTFRFWVAQLRRHGYTVDWRTLKACDYGAPTIRKRLFLVARCDGEPIRWPKPSHGTKRKPYRTAAGIIDWSLPCPSIFLSKEEGRALRVKRPLAEATMRRIARGVMKYVVNAAKPFIVPVTHPRDSRVYDIAEPTRTITSAPRGEFALVAPFVTYAQHKGSNRNPLAPLHTIAASPKDYNGIIGATLVQTGYGERNGQAPRVPGLDKPLGTVVNGQKHGVVAAHLSRQFGNSVGSAADAPLGTVTAGGGGKTSLVAAFMAQHNGGMVGRPMQAPVSTLVGKGCTQALVAASLSNLYSSNTEGGEGDPDKPLRTVTAGGRHQALVAAFLLKYYGTDQDPRLEDPLHTQTTKHRFGLVTVQIGGEEYVISDIGMRMLTPRELFRAQGFSDSYRIDADGLTKTDVIRLCGNSVPPPMAAAVAAANVPAQRRARDLPLFGRPPIDEGWKFAGVAE